MCKCVDVKIGSYANQVELKVPDNIKLYSNSPDRERRLSLWVDRCLAQEIQLLWSLGIVTTGCCCGHNKNKGYIGVAPKYIPTMLVLGYKIAPNSSRRLARDSFFPKTNNN